MAVVVVGGTAVPVGALVVTVVAVGIGAVAIREAHVCGMFIANNVLVDIDVWDGIGVCVLFKVTPARTNELVGVIVGDGVVVGDGLVIVGVCFEVVPGITTNTYVP